MTATSRLPTDPTARTRDLGGLFLSAFRAGLSRRFHRLQRRSARRCCGLPKTLSSTIFSPPATALGAPLLAASLPRAYVDLNRAPDELDPALILGVPRLAHNPRISSGLGVIPRVVAGGRAIYSGKLALAEAEARLRRCLAAVSRRAAPDDGRHPCPLRRGDPDRLPFHAARGDESHARHGPAPPGRGAGRPLSARRQPRGIIDRVEAAFAAAGFRVGRNSPFAGAYIAQTYGRPSARHHVVQVEIDRALYMDEARIRPLADFDTFRTRLMSVVAELCDMGRKSTASTCRSPPSSRPLPQVQPSSVSATRLRA